MEPSLRCAHCGSDFPRGQLVRGDFSRDAPVPEMSFCSLRCRDADVARFLAMPTCPSCGSRFAAPTGGPGRPATYCSPGCRKQHERLLDRATKALAKDTWPDEQQLDHVEQALSDAQMLAHAWSDDGPALIEPPSARARNALLARLDRLERLRDQGREQLGRENEARAYAELAAADRAERAAAEGADAEWRRELLAGPSD